VAARRRRSPLTAASGSGQIAYHGSSQAVDISSASVLQPAAARQSAPRAVRHSAYAITIANATTKQCRHQLGVPCKPNRRAVSAGMLWTATSCCCSPTASMKPSACEPNPTSPIAATSARPMTAARATRPRLRQLDPSPPAPSTRNGSTTPAVTLTPTPAARVSAPAR